MLVDVYKRQLHLGHLHILGAEDGVVLADVDIAGILIVRDGVHIRDVGCLLYTSRCV